VGKKFSREEIEGKKSFVSKDMGVASCRSEDMG
jgi:hypothetical protein